jgi:hypothetical protein
MILGMSVGAFTILHVILQMQSQRPLAKAKQASAANPAVSKTEIDDQFSANPFRDL